MAIRFSPQRYRDCETCEGEGFIVTGIKVGFNVKNMEVTADDDGYCCPECMDRSRHDYEYAMELKAEMQREDER